MSTDRELLELAAKAAEINHHHIDDDGVWWRAHHMAESVYCWNPLTDDGDALRLAVTLWISVEFNTVGSINNVITTSWRDKWENLICSSTVLADDVAAATRRAIVRAAAEIGRSLP